MSTKKKILIIISVPVIVIAVILTIYFSQPNRLYFGDRITGDITVYVDGRQYGLENYDLSCVFCGNMPETASYSVDESGSLLFSTKCGEYGDYKFSISKNSSAGDIDKIVSSFSFDYLSLNNWRVSKIHYALNLTRQHNGYKADVKIDYSYSKENAHEEGRIENETVTDEVDPVTGEAHCTTFGG